MVFWGAEVKPGLPFTHSRDKDDEYEGSRLHLSQATLGLEGKGKERTVVKCKVGDGPEHLICSLTPGVSESCSLDLLFDQDVIFSVTGSTSVHLVGFFMPLDDECDHDDEDDDDYDYELGDYDDDDFDFDEYVDEEDSDIEVPASTVRLEEVEDEQATKVQVPTIEGAKQPTGKESKKAAKKRLKAEAAAAKKATVQSASEVDDQGAEEESEDEDGFPLPPKKKQAVNGSAPLPESSKKLKKKDKKDKPEILAAKEVEKNVEESSQQATADTSSKENTAGNGNGASAEAATKGKSGKKGPAIRKFPNGLEIEEIAMGKPDAKQAKLGKKVSVWYTGKLKASGKIFDSNIRKKPFSFRLGVGEVIKGWDVSVAGMRVGDKRKITVPPAMGYGAKGVPGSIPGNAWLVFDVEMTDVGK